MQRQFNSLMTAAILGIATIGLTAIATAQDKKADPTGTWTWTRPARGGGDPQVITLKLKMDGDKVTGKLTSPGRGGQSTETEIQAGKLKGDELSFTVTREFQNNKITIKYSGKISGDTIKGKTETERDGQTQSRDWEAKRKS